MEMSLTKHNINTEELVFSGNAEIGVEDTFQIKNGREIKKILKCYSKTTVSSKYISDSTVTVEGTVCVWIIYLDEKGCLAGDEHSSFFSKTIQAGSDLSGGSVRVFVQEEKSMAKILAGASVGISAQACLEVLVYKPLEKEIICDIDAKNIEQLRGTTECTMHIAFGEKNLVVEEEFSLGHSQPAAKCILRKNAEASIDEIKIMGTKVMVKGKIKVYILYHTVEGKRPGCFEESFPFSQLVDVAGINDDCKCDGAVKILFCELTPRASGDGEIRSFTASVKLSVSVKAYCEQEIPTVLDAYSVVGGYAFKKEEIVFKKLKEAFCDRFVTKKNLEFTDGAVSSVIDMWSCIKCSSSKFEEGKLKITGTALVNLLVYDCDGNPECYERPVDFEYTYNLEEKLQNPEAVYEINVSRCSYTILGENTVAVTVEPFLSVSIYENFKCEAITEVVKDESLGIKSDRPSSIVLYFADSGEKVWDIARRYNSSAEEIKALNSIKEDILTEPKKFIIPTK